MDPVNVKLDPHAPSVRVSGVFRLAIPAPFGDGRYVFALGRAGRLGPCVKLVGTVDGPRVWRRAP